MEEFHNLMTNEQYNKFIGETEENREKESKRRRISIIMNYTPITENDRERC